MKNKNIDIIGSFLVGIGVSFFAGIMLWLGIKNEDFLLFIFGAMYLPFAGTVWSEIFH